MISLNFLKMENIVIKKQSNTVFEVTIESGTTTTHTVTIPQEYYQRLTGGKVAHETLLEKSFEFLLQREPNTSILRSFELKVIARYFPEYERIISNMF